MAQYVYDANKYPVGTKLADLGCTPYGANEYVVTEIGATGRKRWVTNGVNWTNFNQAVLQTDNLNVLLICDFTPAEVSLTTANLVLYPFSANTSNKGLSSFGVTVASNGTPTKVIPNGLQISSTQKDTALSGFSAANVTAIRGFSNGTSFKSKAWQATQGGLQAAEPATWDYEATLTITRSASSWITTDAPQFTAICIGTAGDAAPYPNPSQTVTTPSGLTISNITSSSADASWS